MHLFCELLRLAFAGIFLAAATGKALGGSAKSRKAVSDFGVPPLLVVPVSFLLPLVELATGLLLLVPRFAEAAGIAAAVILVIFNAVIAANLIAGRKPPCNCFGQMHSEPIGWKTLARNAILAAIAAWLAWRAYINPSETGFRLPSGLTGRDAAVISIATLVLMAIVIEGFLLLHQFRQNGRILLRLEMLESNRSMGLRLPPQPLPPPRGLPIGKLAPDFDLPNLSGGRTALQQLIGHNQGVVLIFSDPNCGPCNALMPDAATWQKTLGHEVSIVIISHGRRDINRTKASEHGVNQVLIETSKRNLAKTYHALGTPTAVAIRSDGTVGSYPVAGADEIRRLIVTKGWTEAGFANFRATKSQPNKPRLTLPIGSAAPPLRLSDLRGHLFDLGKGSQNATVLLFWNMKCGFCQRMIPRLKEWETLKSDHAVELVVVSSGSADENLVMGLRSVVLLDDKFEVGHSYGASGTPSGILIDEEGNIASELAVGESSILELLTRRKFSFTDKQDDSVRQIA